MFRFVVVRQWKIEVYKSIAVFNWQHILVCFFFSQIYLYNGLFFSFLSDSVLTLEFVVNDTTFMYHHTIYGNALVLWLVLFLHGDCISSFMCSQWRPRKVQFISLNLTHLCCLFVIKLLPFLVCFLSNWTWAKFFVLFVFHVWCILRQVYRCECLLVARLKPAYTSGQVGVSSVYISTAVLIVTKDYRDELCPVCR